MAASNEWKEYHLTPQGWLHGSEKLDHKKITEPVPDGRVLSILYRDYIASAYGGVNLSAEISYQSDNLEEIRELISQYGLEPHYNSSRYEFNFEDKKIIEKIKK